MTLNEKEALIIGIIRQERETNQNEKEGETMGKTEWGIPAEVEADTKELLKECRELLEEGKKMLAEAREARESREAEAKPAPKMKRYMVVTMDGDGRQEAFFFNSYDDAEDYVNAASGADGMETEVYEYKEETEDSCGGYEFVWS